MRLWCRVAGCVLAWAVWGAGVDVRAADEGLPMAPDAGGPRHWRVAVESGGLHLREEPAQGSRSVAKLADGTVVDNLGGCVDMRGRVWCDVQPLGGGPRGYAAAAFLKPAVGPDGRVAKGPDDSALRAGQRQFDATGTIPCAGAVGAPTGPCAFGVARAGGGNATVAVTRGDGGERTIYFNFGIAIGVDGSEAAPSGPFRATREGDLNLIRVGDERYEIPDAVVLGG